MNNNKLIKPPTNKRSQIFSLCLSKLESQLLISSVTGLLSIKHLGGGSDFDIAASCGVRGVTRSAVIIGIHKMKKSTSANTL